MEICVRAILRSKFTKLFGILITLVLIYFVYESIKPPTFSEISFKYRQINDPTDNLSNNLPVVSDDTNMSDKSKGAKQNEAKLSIDVMITFTKARQNYYLQQKFKTTVRSLFHFATVPINLHILGDEDSEKLAADILNEVTDKTKYKLVHLDVDSLAKQAHEIVSKMQKHFSHNPKAYYADSLFFVSIVMHRVMPNLQKVIMLDADLKFNADIKDLYKYFNQFAPENILGIAHDGQPVYRHNFHMYRNQHKDTRVGNPPPDGLTGFNSGVLLLNLDRMRTSDTYNDLVTSDKVKELAEKYLFKGHLGDQDFFSLISLEYEELFYVLPCTWNRQLCEWWKNAGYADVFEQYHQCEGHINIYHGNCNTKIPLLPWETDP